MVTHLDIPLKSSFLSCEKNTELILQKLFIENKQHSKTLKKLLVVNTKDCFDDKYSHLIQDMSLSELKDKGYIRLNPKLELKEHNEVMSYIVLSYDNFTPTDNPEFRDCIINFDILCHTDYWDLNDYKIRPLQIAGYIDGILNNEKLVGIGTLEFVGCNELILSEHLSGYTLSYLATHGREDYIPENGAAPVYYG
jgi:hypothetical protein